MYMRTYNNIVYYLGGYFGDNVTGTPLPLTEVNN